MTTQEYCRISRRNWARWRNLCKHIWYKGVSRSLRGVALIDGWGESLERHGIRIDIGEVFVSFWNSGEDRCLLSEDEYFGNYDPQSENFEMGGLS